MSSESGQLVNCRLRERCEGKREGKERRGKSRKRGEKVRKGEEVGSVRTLSQKIRQRARLRHDIDF